MPAERCVPVTLKLTQKDCFFFGMWFRDTLLNSTLFLARVAKMQLRYGFGVQPRLAQKTTTLLEAYRITFHYFATADTLCVQPHNPSQRPSLCCILLQDVPIFCSFVEPRHVCRFSSVSALCCNTLPVIDGWVTGVGVSFCV